MAENVHECEPILKLLFKAQVLKYIKTLKKKSLTTHKAYLGLPRLSALSKVPPSLEKCLFFLRKAGNVLYCLQVSMYHVR